MLKRILAVALLLLVAVVMFSGCAKAPVALVEQVQKAIEAAKAAEADVYLQTEFTAIVDSTNKAQAIIEAEKSKVATKRNYKYATMLLQEVLPQATALVEKVGLKKQETKLQVEQKIVDITTQVGQNRDLMVIARKSRQNRDYVLTLENEVMNVEGNVATINQLLADGKFSTALEQATTDLETLAKMNQDLKKLTAK